MARSIEVFSVDQYDAIKRGLGYDIEHRQLSRDAFRATTVLNEWDSWLASREWMTGPVEVCGVRGGNGIVFFLAPGQTNRIIANGHVKARMLGIPRTAVEHAIGEFAIDRCGRTPFEFKAINLPRELLQRLECAIDRVLDPVPGGSYPDQSGQQCLAELVRTVLQRQSASPALSPGTKGSLLFEALDVIDARLADPFTVEDLSDSLHTSTRSVQRLFSRLLSVTPLQYIESRRLNRALRQLLAADPSSTKVCDIALATGCRHLGRFSSAYRVRFGEQPRDTLRSSCA